MHSHVDKTKTKKRYYGFDTKIEPTGETSGFNVSVMSSYILSYHCCLPFLET